MKFFDFIKPYKWKFILGIFFLFGASLANLAFPRLLGDLVNAGNAGNIEGQISQIIILLLIIMVVQAVFSYFRSVLFIEVSEKVLADIRQQTYNHLIKLPLVFFEKHRVGELNSRISADISLLQETLTFTMAQFVRQIVIVIGGIVLLAITSMKLTLFMLAIIPPTVIIGRFFLRFIRKYARKMQDHVAKSNVIVEETMQGIQSVKVFTNEDFEIKRYKRSTTEIMKLGIKGGIYRGGFSAFLTLGLFGAIVAVIWKGAIYLADGEIEAGEMFSYVIYSVFIGSSISGLAGSFASIQKFAGATEKLFEITETQEEDLNIHCKDDSKYDLKGNIELNNLSFAYSNRDSENVLNNISLKIESQKTIAIVGASGAGKTTLASLLLRLHNPTSGDILFDGVDSMTIPISALRRQISIVPQDVFLFGGSIKENIAYGKPDASDDEIFEAAKKANALEFIERFPDKFNTLVGERGMQVSGGQRQRIAIARAILKNPKILILDEATSSLDSESEKLVQEALKNLLNNRTSIIIAHRLSTIKDADQIVVLDKGSVAEIGTHDELLKKSDGIYKNLSNLQFSL